VPAPALLGAAAADGSASFSATFFSACCLDTCWQHKIASEDIHSCTQGNCARRTRQ
jgi:hypothetical protein